MSRAVVSRRAFLGGAATAGAFVLGTTGEFPALSFEERTALTKLSVDELGPHMRVIVHVGAPSLFEVLRLIEAVREAVAQRG